VLNAWGNQLSSLPDSFGNLQQLLRLGLKGNHLVQLPDSFTQLTSLVELFLTDNKLTTLPAGEERDRGSVVARGLLRGVTVMTACDIY
jgi:Leucine-rich repeat (LRR) protein